MAEQFPPEIIYEILSRLPIKSLARFRCVCKPWLKYINDPYLQTIHVQEEPTPIIFEQFPCVLPNNGMEKQCKISYLRVIQGTTTMQKVPILKLSYKGPPWGSREKLVLGSCNGLTLVCYERDVSNDTFRFAVINPVSKERHNLPPISIKIKSSNNYNWFGLPCEAAGIGFDESTSTLKTVYVILKKHIRTQDVKVVRKQLCAMVHCSGMSSWREMTQVPAYPINGEGVFGHGRLHWLVDGLNMLLPIERRKIVWFDMKLEEFGLLDPPTQKGGDSSDCYFHLVDLNGEVGFACLGMHVELWILKQEGWVRHCSFDVEHILPQYGLEVLGCWNKDGDILLSGGGGERLFVYNQKTGDLQQVDRDDPCKADFLMYRSSLFSITSAQLIKGLDQELV